MQNDRTVLDGVPETLFIPLWARAVENGKAEPLLRDPKAAEIMQRIEYDFDKFARTIGVGGRSQLGCVMRGQVLDRWVARLLGAAPESAVIEIGAGLDTRFERVDNGRLLWIDLDLPEVIDLRRTFFEEQTRRVFVAESILDDGWVERIRSVAGDRPKLFLAEGVLMYFEETEVKDIFARIADAFPGSHIAFDAVGPFIKRMQSRHDALRNMNAPLKWALPDVATVTGWRNDYVREDVFYLMECAQYVRALPRTWRLLFATLLRGFRKDYVVAQFRLGATD